MDQLFPTLSSIPPFAAYLIIFLVIFVEGEIILLFAGILARQHYINFFPIIIIAFAASILHDLLYWWIGRRLAETENKNFFFFITKKRIEEFLVNFEGKNGIYIFISKFTWGLTRLVLIAGGYKNQPRKEILRYSIPAGFIWSVGLVSTGYVFAAETHILKKDILTATLLITAFVLGVIFIEYLVKRLIKTKS